MKAYVVSVLTPIFPFRRAASSFVIGDETVGMRLRRQLHEAGLEVVEVQSLSDFEGPGCALQDNLVLADAAVQTLVTQLRSTTAEQSCQWSVDASLLRTVLYDTDPQITPIPVWLFGARGLAAKVNAVTSLLEISSLFTLRREHRLSYAGLWPESGTRTSAEPVRVSDRAMARRAECLHPGCS